MKRRSSPTSTPPRRLNSRNWLASSPPRKASPGLEVNISCPNVKNGGVLFGQDPALAAEVTQAVKKHAGNLPVIVKLSPNVTDITAIAKAAEQAGADAISCINTITGMGVDVKTPQAAARQCGGGGSPAPP